jgi:HTH-type transcriptional regulator, transcriptional repressor of NAD biosynthesis genes
MTPGRVGMYGGKFLPIHMGHVHAMIRASTMVDELHIIVSYDTEYEKEVYFKGAAFPHIPFHIRQRWWTQLTKNLPHVHVHAIEEKQTGHFHDWVKGSLEIKKDIGKPIDIVFSSEPSYTEYFAQLYPAAKHIVIDAERKTYNISATKLRTEGVMKHWHMLPDVVKPYFVKEVVVVGTESCGKSTLVHNLAQLYNTTYVEEFGRIFYERLGGCEGITIESDFPRIAFEHKYHQEKQREKANKIHFVDTEAIVTQYFSIVYLGKRQPVLDEVAKLQRFNLWLFLEPDVQWVDDGTRSFGEQEIRERNNALLKDLLNEHGISYISISGSYQERLETAIHHVNELLGINGL